MCHLHKKLDEIKQQLVELIIYIWKNHQSKCWTLGRELMRSLQEVYKLEELKFISKDLEVFDQDHDMQIYKAMLYNKYSDGEFSMKDCVMLQIPPFMEQYTTFILNKATKHNFNKHLNWMFERMKIVQSSISESVILDYIRYILIVAED